MAKTQNFGRFKKVSDAPPRRMIVASWGREKSGKNHLGLTAPGPIFGQYFDPGGLEGMVEKFLSEGKEVLSVDYRFNKRNDDQKDAKAVKAQFIEDYADALKFARLIQWDEAEFWEACRFAEFGRESAKGREYGPLNGEYRGLIQEAYDAGVNLHLIQKVKEKWEDDKPTGEMKPTGFTQAANIVQVNVQHRWSVEDGFTMEIMSCRQNMGIAGQVYPALTWAELGQLVYPDTTEEDWS